MPKTDKKSAPRKPIKAKGTLPVPKQTPARVRTKWYQRRGNQVILGLVLVSLIGLGVKLVLDARDRGEALKEERRAVLRLERRLQSYQTKLADPLTDMTKATSDYKAGTLTAEDFKKKTDSWLAAFTEFDNDLRTREISPNLDELSEARATLVRGSVIYIDAVKAYQLAGSITEPATRDEAIKQGDTLVSHATSIIQMGQRLIRNIKDRLGILPEGEEKPPIDLPPVQPPPPGVNPPGGPGGAIPGGGGLPPGLPPGVQPQP